MTLWWELMCHQWGGSLGAAPQGLQPIWRPALPRELASLLAPAFPPGPPPSPGSPSELGAPAPPCPQQHQAPGLVPPQPCTGQGLGATAGRGKETSSPCTLLPLPFLLSTCPRPAGRGTHRRCPRGRHGMPVGQRIQMGDHRQPQPAQGHQLTLSASPGLGDVLGASHTWSRLNLPASLRPPAMPPHRRGVVR